MHLRPRKELVYSNIVRAWTGVRISYGDCRYKRLATLSVGHLYNLRRQADYQVVRTHWTKTRGQVVPIGERRAPTADGRPVYIRIDSVLQGDQDGHKRLYHINAVDCLKPGITLAELDALAAATTDNEAALQLNTARTKPFQSIHGRSQRVA